MSGAQGAAGAYTTTPLNDAAAAAAGKRYAPAFAEVTHKKKKHYMYVYMYV
jgi:hypothetical protein